MPWPKGRTATNAVGSDHDVMGLIRKHGVREAARKLNVSLSAINKRRRTLEERYGEPIRSPNRPDDARYVVDAPGRVRLDLADGIILIGSDSHYWPGEPSTAHRAFVRFCGEMKPKAVIKNGDVLDGASISHHAPIGWEKRPTLIEEIEICQERLSEIVKACKGRKTLFYWPLGNHDARFESRLANVAPEYARIHGVHLQDHFGPEWQPCWSLFVNDDVVIKHRFKGGMHAPQNNTLWAGRTIITGHLHSLKVQPISDYNGDRWGVDCGCLADPYGPQFADYTEDNPRSWRSGFIVLTFVEGELLQPEMCRVVRPGVVDFRGKLIEV